MLDRFKNDQNAGVEEITTQLTQVSEAPASSTDIKDALGQLENTKSPTLMLGKIIKEFLKSFDVLMSTRYLARMRDNVALSARRSKIDSFYKKIVQKDTRWIGNSENNIQPLVYSLNTRLEELVNKKIETEKYAMKIPLVTNYVETRQECRDFPPKFRVKTQDKYKNYYF
jgi:hypothetical protein